MPFPIDAENDGDPGILGPRTVWGWGLSLPWRGGSALGTCVLTHGLCVLWRIANMFAIKRNHDLFSWREGIPYRPGYLGLDSVVFHTASPL